MGTAAVEIDPARASDDPLRWLGAILWPGGNARLLVDRRRDRAGLEHAHVVAAGDSGLSVGYRWWAAPSATAPELLVPSTSIRAARTAVRRYHDGFRLRRRARSWSAELLMRSPRLTARVLDRRLVAAAGTVEDGLLADLAAAWPRSRSVDELHVAVTLARPKSNRKPVLQLINQDGRCLGWAKVGWNPWSRDLVANEADWLGRRPRNPLSTPQVLQRIELQGHLVVVTSGVVGARRPRRVSTRPPAPDIQLAIADLGVRARVPLTETPWWNSVREVIGHATDDEVRAIERVTAAVGSSTLEIGAWHGDLTPWNLISGQVIDWEFAADGVPLGFDLCHFHTQVGMEMKGLTAAQALDRSARLSPQGLAELGVDPHNQINVHRLYLVELIRRTLALRAAGLPVDQVEQGRAATERLTFGSATSNDAIGRAGR